MQRYFDNKPWLLAAVIVALTLLAYQPVWHAGFIWDDDAYVTENQALRSVDGLRKIWSKPGTTIQYYPLVFTSFWTEYHLWKLQPLGYHLVNVLLHALNAVLLWRVLRRLELPGAWLAAAIFALHPVTVESVAWITERKNVLSCLFYLLAALAYLRFQPLTNVQEDLAWDWRFYPLVLAAFLCALSSKTVTCSLPAVLLLVVWWKTGCIEKRDILAMVPLFVFGAALGLVTIQMEKHLGARGAEWTLSFVQRCLIAGRALWFYAGKLFWPRDLMFIYPRWEIDARVAWQYLFPVAALVVLIALWLLRSRIGRGPLVAVLCFAGMLAPALGFFDLYPFRYSYVADHFQYVACIGLIALAVSAGSTICRRIGGQGRSIAVLASAALLAALGSTTWRQARVYRDSEALWWDTLVKNPGCWMAHINLGVVLIREGRTGDAIRHCEQALQLKPDLAEAHDNLGAALLQLGKEQQAIEQFEQALRINPDYAEAHYNMGVVLQRAGEARQAMEQFEQAVRLKPNYAVAHRNLGIALFKVGRVKDAIRHYETALQIEPDLADAHYGLGLALSQIGRVHDAMGHYEQALRINPDYAEADNNLAWLLATVPPSEGGDPVRAVTLAQRVCQLTNNRVAAHLDTLAVAYAGVGRFDDAVVATQSAIALARSDGQTQLIGELNSRLEQFRDGHAYREPANAPSSGGP